MAPSTARVALGTAGRGVEPGAARRPPTHLAEGRGTSEAKHGATGGVAARRGAGGAGRGGGGARHAATPTCLGGEHGEGRPRDARPRPHGRVPPPARKNGAFCQRGPVWRQKAGLFRAAFSGAVLPEQQFPSSEVRGVFRARPELGETGLFARPSSEKPGVLPHFRNLVTKPALFQSRLRKRAG